MSPLRPAFLGAILGLSLSGAAVEAADPLVDLSGLVTPIVTQIPKPLEGNNFATDLRYEVRLRNNSGDTIPTHTLVLILDRLSNLAGEDRDPLKGDSFLSRIDILDKDGTTADGRPFFRLPASQGPDLLPRSVSEPILVRFRIPDYTQAFPPIFKVMGERRPTTSGSLDALIQLLIDKGVLTREEWDSTLARSKPAR